VVSKVSKEYEDKFLQELKQEFDGVDFLSPEEEREREISKCLG